jgi:hypothetical protein
MTTKKSRRLRNEPHEFICSRGPTTPILRDGRSRQQEDPHQLDQWQARSPRFTNGAVYFALPSGQMIETYGSVPKTKLARSDYRLNRYYYAAVLATATFFLAVWIRVIRTEKQTKASTIL